MSIQEYTEYNRRKLLRHGPMQANPSRPMDKLERKPVNFSNAGIEVKEHANIGSMIAWNRTN